AAVPARREECPLAAGEAGMPASLPPPGGLEPLGGVAPEHRAGTDHVELAESHPDDLPAQGLVGDDGRQLPLSELAVAVEHQGTDIPGGAQQAVEPPPLGLRGADGDAGASVQGGSHGDPSYGRPPTKRNACLPPPRNFFRKFVAACVLHASVPTRPDTKPTHDRQVLLNASCRTRSTYQSSASTWSATMRWLPLRSDFTIQFPPGGM